MGGKRDGNVVGRFPAAPAVALAVLSLFFIGCAKPVNVKIHEAETTGNRFAGAVEATGPSGPQLSFCVMKGGISNTFRHRASWLKDDDYYLMRLADFFKRDAPFKSIETILDDSGANGCDVLIAPHIPIYVTPLGRVEASVYITAFSAGKPAEKMMEASARDESSVENAGAKVGQAVFNAFAPGTGLYGKIVARKSAASKAFEEAAMRYRIAPLKPVLPEEARRYKVQAEAAFSRREFKEAADRYLDALKIAPWWPEGHFNRALILGELGKYGNAVGEMRKYLLLVPEAPDARAAQDKIYEWEGLSGRQGGTGRN
ncbi:MAG: tetratricopeptide repeat protein [Thermodesulfobacteriota bacterium]